MTLEIQYPAISDLEKRAQSRIPFFAWIYMSSGTGEETLVAENIQALNRIRLLPKVLAGNYVPDTKVDLFGKTYDVPFGVAPMGMSGLIWPGAEKILAAAAAANNFPYCLSMVSCEAPETIAKIAGDNAWFQLYPPRHPDIQADMLKRAAAAGIKNLLVTVDVPVGSRRERQLKAGLTMPPKMTPRTIWGIATRPAWALATLAYGQPRFRGLTPYIDAAGSGTEVRRPSDFIDGLQDWAFLEKLRDTWKGALIIKGIMSPDDATRAASIGLDGVVVSNHGARQMDGALSAIDALPAIVEAVSGKTKIIYDSGLRGGVDIIRALALGADFCLLGRPFLFSVAALGSHGGAHAAKILRDDLTNNMIQLGAKSLAELPQYKPHNG